MKTRKILAIAIIVIMFLAVCVTTVNAWVATEEVLVITSETLTTGQTNFEVPTSASLEAGKTLQLNAYIDEKTTTGGQVGESVEPTVTHSITGAATDITWTSTDTTVATVSSTGLITGLKAGTTTIKATTTNENVIIKTVQISLAVTKANFYDFSNAKVEMVKESDGLFYEASIKVTGIDTAAVKAYKEANNASFYLFISDKQNSTLPTTTTEALEMSLDNKNPKLPVVTSLTLMDNNTFGMISNTWSNEIYSLKGDTLYGTILESYYDAEAHTNKVHASEAKKFTKPAQEAYGNKIKFSLYDEWTYMAVNEPSSSNQEKMLMQVAKVNDISKYTDENKYTKLMEDLKNTTTFVYNSEVTFNRNGSGGTNAINKDLVTSKLTLEPDSYYFIYAKLLGEDGKYKEIDDIELYRAIGHEGNVSLIAVTGFDKKQSDDDDGNVVNTTNPTNISGDNSIATKKIPQTGATPVFMIVLGSVVLVAGVFVVANKKYRDIK